MARNYLISAGASNCMNIMMTGADGFIGTNLREYLKNKEYNVIPFTGDVRDRITAESSIDCVIHLAAVTERDAFRDDLYNSFAVNVHGTLNTLEFCKKSGVKIIYVSTCGVYGNSNENVISESLTPLPYDSYSESKLIAENLCRRYSVDAGVNSVILRLFNVYGGGQSEPFLVPYIINCLNNNTPVTLKTPHYVRDFVYIKDICRAIESSLTYSDNNCEVFNIGSGTPHKVSDLPEVAAEIIGCKFSYAPVENKNNSGISYSIADISKAEKILKWKPKFTLHAGLTDLIKDLFKNK